MRFKAPELPFASKATKTRFWTAGKETLLALRDLLDMAIEQAEKAEKTKTKKRNRIEVQ